METTVFLNNRSQAIRLPKAVALSEDVKKVEIIAIGYTRIITPVGESWDSWFGGENMSTDFIDTHDQSAVQERESF